MFFLTCFSHCVNSHRTTLDPSAFVERSWLTRTTHSISAQTRLQRIALHHSIPLPCATAPLHHCPPLCSTTAAPPQHPRGSEIHFNEWIRRLRIANIRIRIPILRGVLTFSWEIRGKIEGNREKSVLERVNRTRNKQDGQTARRTRTHTLHKYDYRYISIFSGGALL